MNDVDRMIAALRALGKKDVEEAVAKKAEVTLGAALRGTLSAGQTPEGAAWAPRKSGGRAYINAASKLEVSYAGNRVMAVVSGGEAYGHYGAGGVIKRQMLPDAGAGIPASVDTALDEAAALVWAEAMAK